MWEMPHMNESNYDEIVPEHLRAEFYYDYPLLKRVYDLALATYRDTSRSPITNASS
jgi:hypothetical protein